MSGFSPHWLALRELADRRARSPRLLAEVRAWAHAVLAGAPLPVIDLAAGTGASLRAIAPYLPTPQMWTLIDHDQALLNLAVAHPLPGLLEGLRREGDLQVRLRAADLSREDALADCLRGDGERPFLITASALFDLVSADWCRRLVRAAARPAVAIYAALTYDGRISLSPPHPFDHTLRSLFNRHQHRSKGFGAAALGPEATDCLAHAAQTCGARVRTARSDWQLGPGQPELMRAMLDGWCTAAQEMAAGETPDLVSEIERWSDRRMRQTDAGLLRLIVGHRDLFAAW